MILELREFVLEETAGEELWLIKTVHIVIWNHGFGRGGGHVQNANLAAAQ